MAGIRDVAKMAGVSPSTVSRVFSGVAFVEQETKDRVICAARELKYKPNLAARSLKKGGSKLIGLIIPDIMNPYYPEVVKYFEASAAKFGYALILCDALGDIEKEKEYFKMLQYLFVDGIFYIASTDNIEHIRPYAGSIPMVVVNRNFDLNAPCINLDNVDGACQAMSHLLENGHRRLAVFVNGKEMQYNQERMEGCLKACADYGIARRELTIIQDVASADIAYQKTWELMRRPDRPTGIFMFNDFMAYGVYKGITKNGLKVPNDVSIVGFDDIPQAKYLDPALTTLRHSLLDNAEQIFECLRRQIESGSCAPYSYISNRGRMIFRESVRDIRKK